MAGGSSSKNKGSSYERSLCKLLGETFGGTFIRSTNSGAFIGGKNAARKAGLSKTQISGQKGDIVPPEHMPRLVVEAKAYKEFRFHQLMMFQGQPCAQMDEWLGQVEEAADPGDLVLICFKINRIGEFVAVRADEATSDLRLGNFAHYSGAKGAVWVTDLKQFLLFNRDAILRLTA